LFLNDVLALLAVLFESFFLILTFLEHFKAVSPATSTTSFISYFALMFLVEKGFISNPVCLSNSGLGIRLKIRGHV